MIVTVIDPQRHDPTSVSVLSWVDGSPVSGVLGLPAILSNDRKDLRECFGKRNYTS